MLSGLSPPVSLLLASLVRDPAFCLNPYFIVFLVAGLICFVISLSRLVQKKHSWYPLVWHFVGVGLAGFVLVYWARYNSAGASIFAETLLIVGLTAATYYMRREISNWYGRFRPLIFLGLISCAVLPLLGIFYNAGAPPEVDVSPSTKFIHMPRPGAATNLNMSIVSAYADAWDFRMTAKSPDMLAVYLDGREKGPLEIPFLERNRVTRLRMRIEASPLIQNGTYWVALDFGYIDFVQRKYRDSAGVQVTIGGLPPRPCVIATAVHGSELSEEVQFLRSFRDNAVRKTFAGSSFLNAFESFYYSFSPSMATLISESPLLRALATPLIYPLVESLRIASLAFDCFSSAPELAVTMAGLLAGAVIGIAYLSPMAIVMLLVSKQKSFKGRAHSTR